MTAPRTDGGAPAGASTRSTNRRAEEVVEDVGGRLVAVVSTAVARAREEAEDIWAEAKSIRRGSGS